MTISAVVGVVLFASLDITFDARRDAMDRLAGRSAARIALDLVGADLGSIPPPSGLMAGPLVGEAGYTTRGRHADAISFTTAHVALPTPSPGGDLRRVELRLIDDPDDAEAMLLVRQVTTSLLAAVTPEPETQTLARGALALRLRYYDGVEWGDQWDSVDQGNLLPQAIALTLTLRPGRDRARQTSGPWLDDEDLLTMTRLVMLPAAVRAPGLGNVGR